MEGFLNIKWPRWKRVLVTRTIAMAPTLAIALFAQSDFDKVSSWLNVLQSILLPFAILPVILYTSRRTIMGTFVNPMWVRIIFGGVSIGLVGINFALIFQAIEDLPMYAIVLIALAGLLYLAFIFYLSAWTLVRKRMRANRESLAINRDLNNPID